MDLPDEIVRHIATFTTASSSHQGPPRVWKWPNFRGHKDQDSAQQTVQQWCNLALISKQWMRVMESVPVAFRHHERQRLSNSAVAWLQRGRVKISSLELDVFSWDSLAKPEAAGFRTNSAESLKELRHFNFGAWPESMLAGFPNLTHMHECVPELELNRPSTIPLPLVPSLEVLGLDFSFGGSFEEDMEEEWEEDEMPESRTFDAATVQHLPHLHTLVLNNLGSITNTRLLPRSLSVLECIDTNPFIPGRGNRRYSFAPDLELDQLSVTGAQYMPWLQDVALRTCLRCRHVHLQAHSFPDLTLGWATPEAFAKHLAASRLQRLHIAGRVEFRIKRRGQPATTGTLVDLRQAVMEHASQEFDVEGGSESLAIARRPAAI